MKQLRASVEIAVPKKLEVSVKSRRVTVKGPRGVLKRDFRHQAVDFRRPGKDRILVEKWHGVRKELAAVRTFASHIKNMMKGVTLGYRYKMKCVYAHFPINVVCSDGGRKVEIRNFLGEKFTREVQMLAGVTCAQTGQKDEIQLDGNDLELVSRSAALLHQCVRVRDKDIRKFLDGIYVSETGNIVQAK